MKQVLAKNLIFISAAVMMLATIMMWRRAEPFYNLYFLFAWWSYILFADSWLYLNGGESVFIAELMEFVAFLVPLSAFLWFSFEAFNLRLDNWGYTGVHPEIWIRWPGYFLAFGTVLPGIFVTANLLDRFGIFRRNTFSRFFADPLPKKITGMIILGGIAMLGLPLMWPKYFFPLVWGGVVLLLDPINAAWGRFSLIQEWRQKNWSRTFQLLLAGFICGGLWEFWNFWAGAKWIYTVPLPDWLMRDLKIFEMPVLGFLGFPPFALECFVVTEFARGLKSKAPQNIWKVLLACGMAFSLAMCRLIDVHTVISFR